MYRLLLPLLVCLFTAACVHTEYAAGDLRKENGQANPLQRRVEYQLDPAFYDDPPECVVVLPGVRWDGTPADSAIGAALARHLAQRVTRVIGPRERQKTTRELALDLSHQGDRTRFALLTRCLVNLAWVVTEQAADYAILFSRRRLGVDAKLSRIGDNTQLWRARHVAIRSDGGIPLGPISAVTGIARAGYMQVDHDAGQSMYDDVARRLFTSLPITSN